MAGETEDCINFQAEHLPTGSISFGRFELESLSWERRSSFSHNRYLEEVERYSTPGSVTQKRAILEAHFKKKPLLPQALFENQNECQATENHVDHEASCSDEFEDRDDGRQPEFSWYDETPGGSNEHGDLECEDQETCPSEVPTESMYCSDERVVDTAYERSVNDEMLQDRTEHGSMTSNKDDLCMVANQEPDNKDVIVEELVEKKETSIGEEALQNKEAIVVEQLKSDFSNKIPAVQKKRVPALKKKTQKSPLKLKETLEQKSAKIKQTDRMPVEPNLRMSSSVEINCVSSGKMPSRSTGKLERDSTLTTKPLKQLPLRTPMPKSSDSKNLNVEASVNMKGKASQGNNGRNKVNSEKDVRTMKGGVASCSMSGRSEGGVHRPVSRSKHVADSSKEDATQSGAIFSVHRPVSRSKHVADSSKEEATQSGAIFSFKSDVRAEKRKEYFMKLEEKLHAKEVEMNEIQAKTQEEAEAAIKQLRRSLNFKATPMPSFYNGTVPGGTEGKKNVSTPAKPQKLPGKCTSPRRRTSQEKSTSLSKASNQESPSADESSQTSRAAKPSEKGKKDERTKVVGKSSGKKEEDVGRVARGRTRSTVKGGGIIGGSAAVYVAS